MTSVSHTIVMAKIHARELPLTLTTKKVETVELKQSLTALVVKATATWSMLMISLVKEVVSCHPVQELSSQLMIDSKKLY